MLFSEPPLTSVHADLVYVRATTMTRREKQAGAEQGSRGDSEEKVSRRLSGEKYVQTQSHMMLDAFVWAVTDVAMCCQRRGLWPNTAHADDALRTFCEKVIIPLGVVLGMGEMDVNVALVLLANPDILVLMQRGQKGLLDVFTRYAVGRGAPEPYRHGYWTAAAMKRFAADLEFVAEISHAGLQRLFDECVQHEADQGLGKDGKMSFSCFKLGLVMISQKLRSSPDRTATHRIALLVMRLSVTLGAPDLGPAARSVLGDCRPGGPGRSSVQQADRRHRPTSPAGLSGSKGSAPRLSIPVTA